MKGLNFDIARCLPRVKVERGKLSLETEVAIKRSWGERQDLYIDEIP